MATGRTISASFLTRLDQNVLELCEKISQAILELIPNTEDKKKFKENFGKISKTRDAGAGRGGGKLQRDALCTRGVQGKAPFSNRNLRWHPLVVAEKAVAFAKPIKRIDIEGDDDLQTLCFVIEDADGNEVSYRSDKVHELPERYVATFAHWTPHIEN
jgi:hypothetical protein